MARVVWSRETRQVLRPLPLPVKEEIARQIRLLARFPRMYPIIGGGRFRRHRRFLAGGWLICYRVVENTVYIRGLWPARIP